MSWEDGSWAYAEPASTAAISGRGCSCAVQAPGHQGWLASLGGVGRMIGVWIGGLLYDGLGLKAEGWGFFEGPLFFVANEFLDALPIRQFERTEAGWCERMMPKRSNSSA